VSPLGLGWVLGFATALVVWFLLAQLTDVTCFIRV
jgi:hypothetical protein